MGKEFSSDTPCAKSWLRQGSVLIVNILMEQAPRDSKWESADNKMLRFHVGKLEKE